MVKSPYVDKNGIRKGAWSEEEDDKLRSYVLRYGHWNWRELPRFSGLSRCGKSCRLRWMNYLKPGLRRGRFNPEEEALVLKMHQQLGNKWSAIAAKLPGRSDNEVKNYWHIHLKKRISREVVAHEKTSKPIEPTKQIEGELTISGESSTSPQITLISPKKDFVAPDETNTTSGQLQDSLLEFQNVPASECSSTESSYSSEMLNSEKLGVVNSSIIMVEDHGNGSMESSFVQSHDSFWSDPFFTDTFLYSDTTSNSSLEFSQLSMYTYAWHMEDVINYYDGNNFM